MPLLESSIKEALRLHPPLILLLRVAKEDLEVEGYAIHDGQMVGASPSVSNRIPGDFPDADAFVPDRYLEPREEDRLNPWTWIPFGAGRHRCVGQAFAMMQLKAIFCVLLLDWEFEPAQPAGLLPQRPLEDGGPAPSALCGPLPPPGGGPQQRRRSPPDARHRRPRPVPGPRRVRVRGARRVRGGQGPSGGGARSVSARGPARRARGRRPVLPDPRPVDRGRRCPPVVRHPSTTPTTERSQSHAVVPPQ